MMLRVTVLLALLALVLVAPAQPASAGLGSVCVDQVDKMIADGGSTYCVNPSGSCKVSESRETIFGRESYCLA